MAKLRVGVVVGLITLLATAMPAAANVDVVLDGAANLNFTSTSAALDGAPQERLFADIRPGLLLQTTGERLVARLGYQFSGSLSLDGTDTNTYSNAGSLSLATELSNRTQMSFAVGLTQGGTAFQLSSRPADAGQPAFRAPDNPALLTATAAEALVWSASAHSRVSQGLQAAFSAPQENLDRYSTTVAMPVSYDRIFARDSVGVSLIPSAAFLRPLTADAELTTTLDASLIGRWNHDFSWQWNGSLTAGVQQVLTLSGNYPLAILPTAAASAQVLLGRASAASFTFTHGAASNLQTGTLTLNDQIGARAFTSFSARLPRELSASVGFLHATPLGQAESQVTAGTGDAVQGDVGFNWGLDDNMLAIFRYSVAYQFNQGGNLDASLAHVLLVGVTVRYAGGRKLASIPVINAQRVDAADAPGFGGGENKPPGE